MPGHDLNCSEVFNVSSGRWNEVTQQRGGLECFRFRIILNDPVSGAKPGDHRFRHINARNWVVHFPLYIDKYWEFLSGSPIMVELCGICRLYYVCKAIMLLYFIVTKMNVWANIN